MPRLLWCVCCALLSACGSAPQSAAPDELDQKEEYSILQSFDEKYKREPNAAPVLLRRGALGSDFDVIGLPASGKPVGYVWFISNPKYTPPGEQLDPNQRYVVNDSVLSISSKQIRMTPTVRAAILDGSLSSRKR